MLRRHVLERWYLLARGFEELPTCEASRPAYQDEFYGEQMTPCTELGDLNKWPNGKVFVSDALKLFRLDGFPSGYR